VPITVPVPPVVRAPDVTLPPPAPFVPETLPPRPADLVELGPGSIAEQLIGQPYQSRTIPEIEFVGKYALPEGTWTMGGAAIRWDFSWEFLEVPGRGRVVLVLEPLPGQDPHNRPLRQIIDGIDLTGKDATMTFVVFDCYLDGDNYDSALGGLVAPDVTGEVQPTRAWLFDTTTRQINEIDPHPGPVLPLADLTAPRRASPPCSPSTRGSRHQSLVETCRHPGDARPRSGTA
jgi:hypothetical protein